MINIAVARRTSEQMRLLTAELDRLFEEVKFIKGETQSLQTKLHQIGIEFGLDGF